MGDRHICTIGKNGEDVCMQDLTHNYSEVDCRKCSTYQEHKGKEKEHGFTYTVWGGKVESEKVELTGIFILVEWNGLGLDNLSIVLDVPDEDNPNGPDEPIGPKFFDTKKEAEDWASENLAFDWKVVEL